MEPSSIALGFSGGLDTSYCLAVLADAGHSVTTVTVDTGGFDSDDMRAIEERATTLGSAKHVVADGRARMYDEYVTYIIKANYLRNGVYPSCVGIERMLQAEELVRVALAEGINAIAHGSTGAGNDHVRFDAVIRALAPDAQIIALIRDGRHTREEERDFLTGRGHPVDEVTAAYSYNKGILGTSIGGEETYGTWEYLPPHAWPGTRSIDEAPDEPAELLISFQAGLPNELVVAGRVFAPVDGIGLAGYDILRELNRLGAEHGVGRGIQTGQTIMGIPGRLGFEAPGMLILNAAHRELERIVLTQRQQALKSTVGTLFGDLLHEGHYYDPVLADIRAMLDRASERVTGDVRVRLHKGNTVVLGSRSPHSLVASARALGSTYGYGSSRWTGEEARAFAHIYSVPGLVARAAAPAQAPSGSDSTDDVD